MADVIDQREVQKRGGVCAKLPSACVVSDILSAAGIDARRLTVFDTTYGRGTFWAAVRPRILIASDVVVHEWVVDPDVFIKKPVWHAAKLLEALEITVDLVAVDPPWSVRGSSTRRYYGVDVAIGSPRLILEKAVDAAVKLGARWLLLHLKEPWTPSGWRLVHEMKWMPITRYMNAGPTWWGVLERG